MAKQLVCQRFIYKIHSSRLRKANWDLTLPLSEARKNDELVSLADSLILRWIDELNGITDADAIAKEIKAKIKTLRKEEPTLQSRRQIKKLYSQLDAVQFKADYLCVVMDKKKDYTRACKGFKINGVPYHRLLGTNGGIKNSTIVFVSDRVGDELRRRIENGRNQEKELVPAKLEAYRALTCSASIPVSMPDGILIVSDCETEFLEDIIYINDEAGSEPTMETHRAEKIVLDDSDGYGMMLPSLAEKWGYELGLEYIPSGVNTRFSWEKGMVFCFDFLSFASEVASGYIVKDAWGNDVDIRNVELVLTTSMLKLWDSYDSCEQYLECCRTNHYTFGITKVCPRALESERTLNYQFIQSYDLSDDDIEELIKPTMDQIHDILHEDRFKSILYLAGTNLNDRNIELLQDGYVKALMIESEMVNDPYVQGKIYRMIKNRINEAKIGVLNVHGNYSIISGDPYSLCQHIFGLEVTGLLEAGEIYNKYWTDTDSEFLACFRAPMTAHNNVRKVRVNRSERARYWYKYMQTCTILNSWDTITAALNGADKDGDLVLLTDNRVLVDNLRELPALMCVQRRAEKKVVTEGDIIQSNINSFGDEIGKITNRITAMFEVQSHFDKGSREYEILDYRIKCGQLYQQNSIDKAKGIIAKPMPREWYDRHYALSIEDPETRELYLSILASKKPYFMRYIYPDLMKQYNTYIKNTNKKAQREFSVTVDELLSRSDEDLTPAEHEFVYYYKHGMPVGVGDCLMNKICRKFEAKFDGYISKHNSNTDFDYRILKCGTDYPMSRYNAVKKLYGDYNSRLRDYAVYAKRERVDEDEIIAQSILMREEFTRDCISVCPNAEQLCDIVLDLCYGSEGTKSFAWDMCKTEIIENLLRKNDGMIRYPAKNIDGDITFCGEKFSICMKKVG